MGFSVNVDKLPSLRNYQQALKHYNTVKPIRGISPPLRPLGDRRKQHMRIDMSGDGSVMCYLYNTACVVFHPDDTLSIDGGYASDSTIRFIDRVTPSGISAQRAQGRIYVNGYNAGKHVLKFKRNEATLRWECLNPVQESRRVLDKAVAARVRQKLAPAVRFIKVARQIVTGTHGLIYVREIDRADAMRAYLSEPDEAIYPQLNELFPTIDDLYACAYRVTPGCIVDELVPLGELPVKTPW